MTDAFVVLTPFLLLAVIALLSVAGCDRVFGLQQINPPIEVEHVATSVRTQPAGTDTIAADLSTIEGGELILATLQWRSGSAQQPRPIVTLNGSNLAAVTGGGPFDWNTMRVQNFFGFNPQGGTSAAVQAVVTGNSNIQWNLCVSAYKNVDANNPISARSRAGRHLSALPYKPQPSTSAVLVWCTP